MFNFNKNSFSNMNNQNNQNSFSNMNNQNNQNRLISNYKHNTDGGRRSIEEVKQDRINTNYNVEQAKIKFRNERERKEYEQDNPKIVNPSLNMPSPKNKIDSMNNLRRGNFN